MPLKKTRILSPLKIAFLCLFSLAVSIYANEKIFERFATCPIAVLSYVMEHPEDYGIPQDLIDLLSPIYKKRYTKFRGQLTQYKKHLNESWREILEPTSREIRKDLVNVKDKLRRSSEFIEPVVTPAQRQQQQIFILSAGKNDFELAEDATEFVGYRGRESIGLDGFTRGVYQLNLPVGEYDRSFYQKIALTAATMIEMLDENKQSGTLGYG